MTEFTLSTLDQGAPRTYHRYALCFAYSNDDSAITIERLQRAAKSLVSEIPMLAGVVTTGDQQKPTITVTLQQTEDFAATIKHHEDHNLSYQTICRRGIAPKHISGIDLTPLANDPDAGAGSCCALQANFIAGGGLILVIYLHHAVADVRGVATILRLMSEGLPLRKLDQDALELEAKTVSEARARLSDRTGAPAFLSLARDIEQRRQRSFEQQGRADDDAAADTADDGAEIDAATDTDGNGVKLDAATDNAGNGSKIEAATDTAGSGVKLDAATDTANDGVKLDTSTNRAAIFSFKFDIINQTTEMINSRRALRNPASYHKVHPRDVLVAIIWRAYARARWPTGSEEDVRASVSFPIDMRKYLVPPLDLHWMGNAEITATATEPLLTLSTYYDMSTLERTATIVYNAAKATASDLLVRSRINLMNDDAVLQQVPTAQLRIYDWTALPRMEEQEMDLGLGLGEPDAIRRTGRGFAGNEVVLLPVNEQNGAWEVQVELEYHWMTNILRDDLLRAFLWSVVH